MPELLLNDVEVDLNDLHCVDFDTFMMLPQRRIQRALCVWITSQTNAQERVRRTEYVAAFMKHVVSSHLVGKGTMQRKDLANMFLLSLKYWGAPHEHVHSRNFCGPFNLDSAKSATKT